MLNLAVHTHTHLSSEAIIRGIGLLVAAFADNMRCNATLQECRAGPGAAVPAVEEGHPAPAHAAGAVVASHCVRSVAIARRRERGWVAKTLGDERAEG